MTLIRAEAAAAVRDPLCALDQLRGEAKTRLTERGSDVATNHQKIISLRTRRSHCVPLFLSVSRSSCSFQILWEINTSFCAETKQLNISCSFPFCMSEAVIDSIPVLSVEKSHFGGTGSFLLSFTRDVIRREKQEREREREGEVITLFTGRVWDDICLR